MRIRSIKPDWLDDELSLCSEPARVLSVGLVLLADDFGRGRAHPDLLLSRVFPGKSSDVLAKALEDLARLRYMILYEVDGQKYFAIRTWTKHQKVDHPTQSKLPDPEAETSRKFGDLIDFAKDSPALAKALESFGNPRASRDPLPSLLTKPDLDLPDRSRSARARGSVAKWRRVPADWQPNAKHRELATRLGMDLQLEAEAFRDHEFDKPKSDADAAFSNWLRRGAKFGSIPSAPAEPVGESDAQRRNREAIEAERAAKRQRDAAEAERQGLGQGSLKAIVGGIGNG